MKAKRLVSVAALAVAIAAPIVAYETGRTGAGDALFAQATGAFPSLDGATGWLNSPPLTVQGLRGKVVVVDFWTYSCINWRRQLPYVRAWAEKYKDQGLVVIGVHTPEFAFERDLDNIRWALKDMRVEYPVAIDSDYGVWRAFANEYWPALYFIDARGRVRHHQFGEGGYDEAERVIQKLLAEAGRGTVNRDLVSLDARGLEAPADLDALGSSETYVGDGRSRGFASPGGVAQGKARVYALPPLLNANSWALAGDWTVRRESAASNQPGARIAYRFHARDLHLVMGPAMKDAPVRFRVLVDGQAPGPAHGIDVDAQGNGTLTVPRMYQLIRQPGPIADRLFEIEFLDAGAEAYSFTFG